VPRHQPDRTGKEIRADSWNRVEVRNRKRGLHEIPDSVQAPLVVLADQTALGPMPGCPGVQRFNQLRCRWRCRRFVTQYDVFR